ncbi:hypothetical protein Ac2012v2_003571 [Leucoagaricus gongylophorus]
MRSLTGRDIFQALVAFLFLSHVLAFNPNAFNPNAYPRKTVKCDAVCRSPTQGQVQIELSYADIGRPSHNTITMVHGWPSVWSTWSKQIEVLKNQYRLLAPDLRGFGYSSHPDDPKSSHTMGDLVQDLICILDNEKVTSTVCMGHDWGSQVCYEAARMRPDIFIGVIGLTVPYMPNAGNYTPIKSLIQYFPRLAYQAYFDEKTYDAAKELDNDVRRSLRSTLRTVSSPPPDNFLESQTSYMDAWKDVKEIPPIPFLSTQEEDYLVASFEHSQFLYTLGFYTDENRRLSYMFDYSQGNITIPQPVLSILPTEDPVADWKAAMKLLNSTVYLPDLQVKFIDGAHWVHLENPGPVNQIIVDWLQKLTSKWHVWQSDEL